MMTAIKENHLKDLNDNLSSTLQGNDARDGYAPVNPDHSNPYTEAENPADNYIQGSSADSELARDEAFGENAGLNQTNRISNSSITPGPGDDDDDLDDDDDFLDDDDEGTLIPIEGDEEDDDALLSADEDEDVIPGTDLDDGDDLLDDDDDDSDISRASLGDLGANSTSRDQGRSSGRMIDHEPGTTEI
jgi:hypothetical protein